MNPNINIDLLRKNFIQAIEQRDYDNEICNPSGTIEIDYSSPEDGMVYSFNLDYEVTSMPMYDEYPETQYEPAYSTCRNETEWDFTGEGKVYVDGDEVADIADIFNFSPKNKNILKSFFEVNDAELIEAYRIGERSAMSSDLNESYIRKLIYEEIDKKDVKDMINKAIDDVLSDTKFRKKVIAITADVLENFMDNLWTRKPFWKSIIKRN